MKALLHREIRAPNSRQEGGFKRRRLAGTFLAVAAMTGAGLMAPGAARAQSIVLEEIADGLPRPVDIAHAGDGSRRLFIVLQGGSIVIHDGTRILPTPFLDLSAIVGCCGEGGLLGLAFHPDYASNGLFFVNYTNRSGDTVIARYRVSSNANVANPGSGATVLSFAQPFGNHNGGQLHFGPDGFLYISSGDGGSGGDPGNRGQRLDTLLGKMLRIDVDSGSPFGIPNDNPFRGVPDARDEIWAYGLRNPWRFSFDRQTGDLFIADVGQGSREEVNFQPANSPGGENYGWRRMEGSRCFNPPSNCNDGSLTLPILEYGHSGGNCSVTGGYRYRGATLAGFAGRYFYADFCTGRIWAGTQRGNGSWSSSPVRDTGLAISAFGEDADGELYIASYDATNGAILRLADDSLRAADATVDGTWRDVVLTPGLADPVVIAGPATSKDRDPGVIRLRRIDGAAGRLQARFQEWRYLDGSHPAERAAFLMVGKGRQRMADGAIWEAGTFKLRGNGKWRRRSFTEPLPGRPKIFLTVQTARGGSPVAVRARNVSRNGFEAALFEEEAKRGTGHPKERVGYLAIYRAVGKGNVTLNGASVSYRLRQPKVTDRFTRVSGSELKLEEEQSDDREVRHARERVAVLRLGGRLFAQQTTDRESDTAVPRRR